MRIIFATGNMGKLREAAEILGEEYELVAPLSMGITDDVEESGHTLRDNSLLKARHIHSLTGENCFADDTGLEVDALGGAPGVHTARYAGKEHDFNANIDKLLREMEPFDKRSARFRSVITLILDGETLFFDGVLEGRIAHSRHGLGGFGYDPVFIPDYIPAGNGTPPDGTLPPTSFFREAEAMRLRRNAEGVSFRRNAEPLPKGVFLRRNAEELTLAEISEEDKNIISHRGLALREMAAWLKNRITER